MEMQGFWGALNRIFEWIMRFSVTNVLWFVCALPIFYFGFLLLLQETGEEMLAALSIVAALSPFFLFPATAALFAVVRKWIMGDEDAPLIRTFFRGYKKNYVPSMIGGFLYLFFVVLIYVNYVFYAQMNNFLQYFSLLFLVFGIITLISMLVFFCILVHLDMKVWQVFKNAFIVTLSRPLTSLFIAISAGVVLYVGLGWMTWWVVTFFMGSVIAYCSFYFFYRMYNKAVEKLEDGNRNG